MPVDPQPRLLMIAQLGLVCVPALIATALGCLLSGQGSTWLAVAIGGAVTLPLALIGALVIVLTRDRGFRVALAAALTSLLVRLGGAGVAAVALRGDEHATAILSTIAVCLGLTLAMETLGSVRAVRPHDGLGESARA